MRARRVLRHAPWPSVGGCSAVAAALVATASLSLPHELRTLLAVLGVSACGAAAAFVLDESGAGITDATPSGRRYRLSWRLVLAGVPVATGLLGVALLDHANPASRWTQLAPLALGAPAVGVCVAAAMRAARRDAPGALAAPCTLLALVVLVLVEPLHRWVLLAPLGEGGHANRTALLWLAAVAVCAAITGTCIRDPWHRRGWTHGRP